MIITNAAGVEQTGNAAAGYKVVVTAGDGVTTQTYVINDVTSVQKLNDKSILVYPNPSTGMIYVSGLSVGNRVFVSNITGKR